jgi:hypothetical protein
MGTWIASLGLVALLIGTLASAGCEARAASEPTETIGVRVAMFGGPQLNGKMALDNAPASGVTVTATDADGTKWTAITDDHGMAKLTVPVGAYTVDSDYCGWGPGRHSRVSESVESSVSIPCLVP